MIAGGIVIAWIGGAMIVDGDSYLTRWLGLILATLVAGSLVCIGCGIPALAGWVELDSKSCSQYVHMDGNWACVPYGEEG
jgi:hypothetical protein